MMPWRRQHRSTGKQTGVLHCRRLPTISRSAILPGALILLLAGSSGPQASAAQPSPPVSSPSSGAPSAACPLTGHRFKARAGNLNITGAVGQTIRLSFTLDPPRLPQGFFLSVNMRSLETPVNSPKTPGQKPDILTGFPDTRMVFHTPGVYRYAVIVSMIAKSSCGGVKADTIFTGEVKISVSQEKSP